MTRFLLLSDSCEFVDVGRPFWREDCSVVFNCCRPCQRSHSRCRVSRDSRQYFLFQIWYSPNMKILLFISHRWPPQWSSGQSSWLQIRRPGFDSRHYQKKKVVGLEWGPLSIVSTTEELLDRKVAAVALVSSVLNLRVPWNAGKLSGGFSSSAQLHIVS
jgi:hypothetical protein